MGYPLDWRIAPFGCLLLCFGLIIMAIVAPLKITDEINKTLEEEFLFTKQGQPGWKRFVNNTQADSAPSYVKVWIVNTTNSVEAQQGGTPHLQEVGPYIFRQYIVNANPEFSYMMNNYTFTQYSDGLSERVITFVPWIYLVFDEDNPENAGRSLTDMFVTPNFAVWGLWNSPLVINQPQLQPLLLEIIVNGSLGGNPITTPSQPFQTRSARELLFGYPDPLLTLLSNFVPVPSTTFQFIRNQTSVEDARSQVNTTTLSCGFPNTVRFQQMIIWQNKSSIHYWDPPLHPEGTPGVYFGLNNRGEAEHQKLFWAQLGRYLGMHSKYESSVKGVNTFHYVFDSKEIQNSTENPTNARYYQNGPSGLLNATSINNIPILYSWPHFYGGDPALRSWYTGLPDPTQANDESFIEVQQVIGLSCKARRVLQGNLPVGGLGLDVWSHDMGEIRVWPNYWMSLESEMTDEQAEQLSDALDFYDRAVTGSTVLLVGGALGSFVAFCVSIYLFYKRRDQWNRGSTIGLLSDEQNTEDVAIGYVDAKEGGNYGARS